MPAAAAIYSLIESAKLNGFNRSITSPTCSPASPNPCDGRGTKDCCPSKPRGPARPAAKLTVDEARMTGMMMEFRYQGIAA
jgi:hypothetical protein